MIKYQNSALNVYCDQDYRDGGKVTVKILKTPCLKESKTANNNNVTWHDRMDTTDTTDTTDAADAKDAAEVTDATDMIYVA